MQCNAIQYNTIYKCCINECITPKTRCTQAFANVTANVICLPTISNSNLVLSSYISDFLRLAFPQYNGVLRKCINHDIGCYLGIPCNFEPEIKIHNIKSQRYYCIRNRLQQLCLQYKFKIFYVRKKYDKHFEFICYLTSCYRPNIAMTSCLWSTMLDGVTFEDQHFIYLFIYNIYKVHHSQLNMLRSAI